MPTPANRAACLQLDRDDPLAPLRSHFELPERPIYLDGNSLGALPRATAARVEATVRREWGADLIRSWNSAGWIDLAGRVGDMIAPLVGAGPGEVIAADSTSVNLYKVLCAAAMLQQLDAPGRTRIVSERANFPTDLYIAESVARQHGLELVLVDADDALLAQLDDRLAVLMLTHVDYRTGRLLDLGALTRACHAVGGLMVWDLAHSAGAVPVDLKGEGAADGAADFAVGCGYKYLNGGPGAPAFVWAHPRHTARMDAEQLAQPLSGWLGHAAPFDFTPAYRPAAGIRRFVCGTPPVLSLRALECGLDVFAAAEAFGGMAALRHKSLALTALFIERVEARCAGHGLELVTPREPERRGSQVSFAHRVDAHAIVQALIDHGVVGDFRAGDPGDPGNAPDLLRFGFTPLYTRYVDAWDAAETLAAVLASGAWRDDRFRERAAVT